MPDSRERPGDRKFGNLRESHRNDAGGVSGGIRFATCATDSACNKFVGRSFNSFRRSTSTMRLSNKITRLRSPLL
jgi:hypothetical protein